MKIGSKILFVVGGGEIFTFLHTFVWTKVSKATGKHVDFVFTNR
ncbi:MAG: hypothetical protein ABJI33_01270 [Balneola sp.]